MPQMTSFASSDAIFSRRWWFLLVVTLAVSGLTFRLGLWQLGRADQKEAIYAQQQAQQQEPALTNADIPSSLANSSDSQAYLYRRVEFDGQWQSQFTVYLANRGMGGQVGFWVLTPLSLNAKQSVLVMRGWVQRDWVDSYKLPPIETPAAAVRLQGLWVAPPSHMMELSNSGANPATVKGFEVLRQNIDIEDFARETGLHLIGTVHQLGEPSEGLTRQAPNILSGADKNKAYAAQWFALSALCAGLFLWFQIFQKIRHG